MELVRPVKIRQETADGFLAYFVELRRFVPVNKTGAEIIEYFFNSDKNPKQISQKCRSVSEKQVRGFLQSLKSELEIPFAGGYPLLKDDLFKVPIAVEMNILKQCNLCCKHCSLQDYEQIMSFNEIDRIFKILFDNKVLELNITGGEVFLHPDIMKIIKLACEKYNFATSIVTNATLLTDKLVKQLEKYNNILMFLVSLEGVGDGNDKIRGLGVFKKVDEAIKRLKTAGFHVEISTTINSQNISQYQNLIDYAKEKDVPINFNLFKVAKKDQSDLVLNPRKYFKFIDDIFKIRDNYYNKIGLTNAAISSYKTNKKKRKTCRATLSGLTIDVKGRMITCPFLNEAGYYNHVDLPIVDDNFMAVWQNNQIFKDFRKENLNECIACAYLFADSVKNLDPYGLNSYIKYCKNQRSF